MKFQVIAASGAVKHEDVVEQVKKYFTKLSTDPTTAAQLVAKEPATFTGSEVWIFFVYYQNFYLVCLSNIWFCCDVCMHVFNRDQVRMIDDDIPLAQFAVAFNGASYTDPDSIALMVIQSMLGSWNKNAGGGKHMG